MYGDAVLDLAKGFSILSGDQLVSKLASLFNCEKIILACDVDGVYTADPKLDLKAELIRELTLTDFIEKVKVDNASKASDVTGLMSGKLEEMSRVLKRDTRIIIINGLKPDRIYMALKGLDMPCTVMSSR